jgi:hypothetical protein
MSILQRDRRRVRSASTPSPSNPPRTPIAPFTVRRREAIALWGWVLVLTACSAPVPQASSDFGEPNSAPVATASSEPPATSTPSILETAPAPAPTTVPLRADEIRSFLEQGSIEDTSQCPSKSLNEDNGSLLEKVAYFETTHYWIEICADGNGALEYYGRKRDQPSLDLAIAAYPVGDRSQEFTAQNGNTVYQINANELVVTQNGIPIIREPVTRSSFK